MPSIRIPEGAAEVPEANIAGRDSGQLIVGRGHSIWLNEQRGSDHVALFVDKLFVKGDDVWIVGRVFMDGFEILRMLWPNSPLVKPEQINNEAEDDSDSENDSGSDTGDAESEEDMEWIPEAERVPYKKM
ncbi:hypothetical protein VKT23_020256 [Stygiomarasmius scandens]|uniref:Uncharacterized protein n=1 Tax=Marasmiellus scandens TaxID=2682957 RepID=A0ABR1IJD8_9AGAR